VVSETFLVAWRRLSDLPEEPLPWLVAVARNTIRDRRRREFRRDRLITMLKLLERAAGPAGPADAGLLERESVIAALGQLTELELEALLLVAWDGLTPREAATVADCTPRAFEVRLSRARTRLVRALATAERDVDGAPRATLSKPVVATTEGR
jgi:RNA polymerase sigma-70 factor (ECF subfamily)